jgi:hypothetical protein
MKMQFIIVIFIIILDNCISSTDSSLQNILIESLTEVKKTLNDLEKRWQIKKYPNFLTAGSMTLKSWDVMKIKLQKKIILAHLSPSADSYIISFMGSSVTAGHDSPQNKSLVAHTQRIMAPAFKILNINLQARNVAQGNNPCFPYDACVNTFAGADSDIVQWEQSFNCFVDSNSDWCFLFENFIRQTHFMPNKPIVVFAESPTPNWKEEECKNVVHHVVTEYENELLTALKESPIKIATELSGQRILKYFNNAKDILHSYKYTGVQVFRHAEYDIYKCQGPYVKEWGCCSGIIIY